MLAEIFNLAAGITLFLFTIHYICYIVQSLSVHTSQVSTASNKNAIKSTRSVAMQSEDAKYIKKRLKGGTIEPHPTENALIFNYKVEATVFGEPGDPMLEESKNCQRIIRLKTLNANTDPAALAKEVVDQCDIIHKSQLAEVQQIIYYLKNRLKSENSNKSGSSSSNSSIMRKGSSGSLHKSRLKSAHGSATSVKDIVSPTEPEKASIRNIDEYVELLYEDLPGKIRGSALILQLARHPDNLEELEKNEALLSAMSRVLREDWRKSLDLSTNIIYMFFCFSTYTRFHNVIIQYKIGSLCMDVIDYELKRFDAMQKDLESKRDSAEDESAKNGIKQKDQSKSVDDLDTLMDEERPKEMEPPRRRGRIPELKQRPKSGNWSNQSLSMTSSLLRSQTLNSSYHDHLSTSASTHFGRDQSCSAIVSSSSSGENSARAKKEEYDRMAKRLRIFGKKQEQLLRVAFYLLLNISENVQVEEKMRRRNITKMLIKTLDRNNVELLVLAVTFLKKLSIIGVNKDDMNDLNIVDKLPRLLQGTPPDLLQVTLKLIFNLSFDGPLRQKMICAGLLTKLVTFLSDDKHHEIVTRILYHMTLDDKVKSMFTYTECVPLATDMLVLNLNSKVDLDLIALCINLALNKRNAQLMIENNRLHTLMARAFKYQDSLLMKMLRNISQHESLRGHFVDFVGDLAQILTVCDNQRFVIECLGILGNLSLPDLDYSAIIENFSLIPWIRKVLVPGNFTDDLVLDTVVFLGTCACDEACAMLLCKADVVLSLIELLKAKQEDDEMVLQIIFVFQQILRNESTRGYMIKDTEAPAYLIDLMHDKNQEIRKVCDFCLDIIAGWDSEWSVRIKLEKFRNHNAQWLEMVEAHQEENDSSFYGQMNADDDDDDTGLPAYLPADYFFQAQAQQQNQSDDAMTVGSSSDQMRNSSAMSSYTSRPVSRYSRDMDDIETMTSSYKSRMTNSNEIEKGSIDELINTDFQCAKGSRGVDSSEIEILTELE